MAGLNVNVIERPLHIPVAVGTAVLVEIAEHGLQFKSELVGMENGSYIILKLSNEGLLDVFQSISAGPCRVVVRYLYRGAVYGFKTSFLKAISKPARLLFVTYPESVEEFNTRTEPRFDCVLPASVKAGEKESGAVIVDISRSGCRCVIKAGSGEVNEALRGLINMNTRLDLKFHLPCETKELALTGMVRNINKDNDKIVCGIMFVETKDEAKALLESFLSMVSSVIKSEGDAS